MDDFGEGFFDQFGQPRKRGKERREIVARLLGTASEPAPATASGRTAAARRRAAHPQRDRGRVRRRVILSTCPARRGA
jgi:hypothetical protein